jgi:uncharacterized membrane protein
MWPTERASRRGLVECGIAAIAFPAAVFLWQTAGVRYLDKAASLPWFLGGLACLVLFGVAVFRIAKRREYPWLVAIAAVALPFFDPTQAPYHSTTRAVAAVRDLVLIVTTAAFIAQSVRRSDELEQRIHLQALAWSYTIVVVLLLIQAMAADLLPPLRATWIASALLAGWVAAWVVTSFRYVR